MNLRVYIVDDEAPARRELKYLLSQMSEVEIVGEASNGSAALRGVMESVPHVVFLDVQMPSLNGLELSNLLGRLPEKPLVIFSTAFEKYALAAFDVEAFDYVLKPFTLERMQKAVHRAIKFLHLKDAYAAPEARNDQVRTSERTETFEVSKKIPLYKGEKIIPTASQSIIFARIEDGDIVVRTSDGSYRTKSTLNELEAKLAACGFVRVHRSSLVNTNHVKEVIPWFNGSYKLVMNDREKTEILVSRYNVKELKQYLNL
jgi:two-component system, LytTR family, response regulator LytT